MGARGRRPHRPCTSAATESGSTSSLPVPSAEAGALATTSACPSTTTHCTASAAKQTSRTFSKRGSCVTEGCSRASRPLSVWCVGCWRKQTALFLRSSPPPMPTSGRARGVSLLQQQTQQQQNAVFRMNSTTGSAPAQLTNQPCVNSNVCRAIPCDAELTLRTSATATSQWCRGAGSPPSDPRSLTVINQFFENLLASSTPSANDTGTADAPTLSPVVSSSSGAEDSFSDSSADGNGRNNSSASSDEDSELLDQALSDLASDEEGEFGWAASRREVVFETIRKAASAVVAPLVRTRAHSQREVVSPARRRKHRVWSLPQA